MPLELVTLPCLSDNYAYLLHNPETKETALIDAPEAAPVLAALKQRDWTLTDVLITHHHYDHIDGLPSLRDAYAPRVIGARADSHRLPDLDLAVGEGDTLTVCGHAAQVIDVSGHTVGHIAFHFAEAGMVFTADSLMAMGCGRLFEGTPDQMWDSMTKLRALPADTIVCSGHEYTAANAKFALTIEPENADLAARVQDITRARAQNQPTVPSILADEMRTNPFLRADHPDVKIALGMQNQPDAAVFAEIRTRKDNF